MKRQISEKDSREFLRLVNKWEEHAKQVWENFAEKTFDYPYKAHSTKVTSSKKVKFPEWAFENFLRLEINKKERLSCVLPATLLKHLQRSYNWRVAENVFSWLKECLVDVAKEENWVSMGTDQYGNYELEKWESSARGEYTGKDTGIL